MYVSSDAKQKIQNQRRTRFYKELLSNLISEADKLELATEDIIEMIKRLRKE